MTENERKELKKKIEERITSVKEDIEDLKEQTKPIAPENAIGRISRMDAINNKSVNEATLRHTEAKLAKLEYAITRIDDPAFGNCTRCGQAIQTARLLLMPESTRCVNCADR